MEVFLIVVVVFGGISLFFYLLGKKYAKKIETETKIKEGIEKEEFAKNHPHYDAEQFYLKCHEQGIKNAVG